MTEDFEKQFYENINNAGELEKLYHKNKAQFTKLVNQEKSKSEYPLLQFWEARLNKKSFFDRKKFLWAIILAVICWIPIKILMPHSFTAPKLYDARIYLSIIPTVFTITFSILLSLYNFKIKNVILISAIAVATGLYIYFVPFSKESQSVINIYIHMPIFLWAMIGFLYCGFEIRNYQKRFEFLLFNGELAVWSSLIDFAGSILAMIAVVLFATIKIDFYQFFYQDVFTLGSIIAFFLTVPIAKSFTTINIASILAKIFAPLTLLTLLVYLVFYFIFATVSPAQDRMALLIQNVILLAVLALIIFINANTNENKIYAIINTALLLACIIVDVIALSAILHRLKEFGLSPNKLTVLGINILMLLNLFWILYNYIKVFIKKAPSSIIAVAIAKYLPIYVIWSLVVMIILPIVFRYK